MCNFQRTRPRLRVRGVWPRTVGSGKIRFMQVARLRCASARHFFSLREKMVGVNGVEPLTPRLSSACSNQLSYTPVLNAELRMWNAELFCILHLKVGGAEETRTPDL